MDTAVLRGVRDASLTIGNNVLIGPRAYLSGCSIEDDVFLATGATVFNKARVGKGSEVRVNGLVHLRTVLPPHSTVPIGWVAVGDPATILPSSEHDRIWSPEAIGFPSRCLRRRSSAAGRNDDAKRYASIWQEPAVASDRRSAVKSM
jgi:carbonic anhydrase/acetyltransferase-like protein (isoleucine patch superfamily)